ncbi:MAG TPA: isoprenylcysteine carboxylmethyltransferase family protein [Mucilaginibacter sp.]|jgi:protein-S-isoprenylcysteine O-methyltransferase Ste14
MSDLNKKAFGGLLQLAVILAVAIFFLAGTIHYWQAWVFLSVFLLSSFAITVYLMKNDPQLLERRVSAGPGSEKEKSQKIIQALASVAFLAVIVFPAADHRLSWSSVPLFVVVIGNILIVAGFYIVFLVFKENTFTSAIIEVSDEQTIISTGPYAIVRHPMYIGALVLLLGTPIALGSWWGLITIVPISAVIVWRLVDEEEFLLENLPGYQQYQQKVRYRLLPFIW